MVTIALPFEKLAPLKENDYVKFTDNWTPSDLYAGKYFVVKGHLFKKYDKSFILANGSTYDLTLDEDSGLLPTNDLSLYEIFVGIKGLALFYIRWSQTEYFIRLEKPEFLPDYSSSTKRYIGFLEPSDTPIHEPKLVIYTTKKMDPVQLRFYNDTGVSQKIVIRFNINHCKLEEVPSVPEGYVVKVIRHWRDYKELGL